MMCNFLCTYVVYDHPRDFPRHYVCRVHHIEGMETRPERHPLILSANLLEIRKALTRRGLTNIGRFQDDDPNILEVWV